ncbi:hypothetical protein BHQ17_00065 [Mycolicibacterium holsaticum]|uniref:Secreted protein n=1 Tax=Mycolicibacterium holsaticum TaxID=152142 RepID=A0A1E3S3G3_9MYCO|nr:hypothetical protein BHQ17_00065 [Mycolicibacterium holsaticum]
MFCLVVVVRSWCLCWSALFAAGFAGGDGCVYGGDLVVGHPVALLGVMAHTDHAMILGLPGQFGIGGKG